MTKTEAMQALKEGRRIRHSGYTDEEWTEQHGAVILFEDGCKTTPEEFWGIRTESWWDDGWSEFMNKEEVKP